MDEKMSREAGSAAAKKLQKSYFDVLGLCCSSEIPLIENILKQLDGVKDVSVIVASRTVIVVHDSLLVSQTQIVNALNQARLEANVKMRGDGHHKKKWPSPYAMASGALLSLSFLKYVYRPLGWLALGAVAVGIFPIALRAMTAIRNIRLDINVLAVIAVAGTIAMHDYLEAATIVFLFSIADWLQSMASHKARAAMSSLMSIAPQKATILETGGEVDVDEVKLNTVLAVKAGEVIPIDGIVVDGRSEVDEKTLTGESFPVSKEKDSSVWAGTINLNGYISVKTTALAEDCVVAKMAKLVEEAQNKRSRTQRFIDKFAQYYTPAIVVIFLCFLVIPIAVRVRNRDHWVELALVVLVSGCPCALVLSTPVATFCALTKAARSGLLIKGGDYLETLAKIKTVAFDKTGTITRGEFAVAEFKSLSTEISRETLLYWVSSIESKSSHPLAAAVVQYGRSSGIVPKPEDVEEFQNYPGEGIYGRIDGRDFFIGNKKIATRAGSQTVLSLESDSAMVGKTVGYIFLGSDLVGMFSLSDECRTGVVEAIRELKSRKIRSVMLTGDSQGAAMNAQNQLGNALDQVYAELLPEDKSKIIQQLKENGPTAMVGDGINDAPALAISDIGISMGISGSALATETGHVILMSNDIRKIPKAINLARKATRKVVENVFLSFFMRVAILALAFAGHPLVWAAVLADTGTCLLVIMNSMLLLRGGDGHRHGHGQKCSRKSYDTSEVQKCTGADIGRSRQQCCSEKNCDSSVLPQVRAECCESTNCASKQRCTEQKVSCESRNCGSVKKCTEECNLSNFDAGSDEIIKIANLGEKARNNCCESTKCTSEQRGAEQKLSCESRNCSSVKKCTGECHPSQFDASPDEIVEIPNPGEKQACCSSSSALPGSGHCKSGTTKTGSEVPNSGRKQGCCSSSSALPGSGHCKSGTTKTGSEVPNLGGKQGCCSNKSSETNGAQCEARTAKNTKESDSEHVPRCCSGNKCSKSQKANLDQAVSDCKGKMVKGNAISCCTTDDLEKNLHCPGSTWESSHKGHHDQVKCDDEQRSGGCRSQCCASSGLQDCERSGGRDGDLVVRSLQDHTETAAAGHGCCSLENREIGGCCRSYMEECCAKSRSGHLGHHGFGGCLTEIVIE